MSDSVRPVEQPASDEKCAWFAGLGPCRKPIAWRVLHPSYGPRGGIARPVCDQPSHLVAVIRMAADYGANPVEVSRV